MTGILKQQAKPFISQDLAAAHAIVLKLAEKAIVELDNDPICDIRNAVNEKALFRESLPLIKHDHMNVSD